MSELSLLLHCPFCDNLITDPRVLPCGESICFECIPDKEFECSLCSEKHQVPPNGFMKNKRLGDLLKNSTQNSLTNG